MFSVAHYYVYFTCELQPEFLVFDHIRYPRKQADSALLGSYGQSEGTLKIAFWIGHRIY